jgi:hypothetical protein
MALLPGGYELPRTFTASGAITIGEPVYADSGVIKSMGLTDQATSEALKPFGIFLGTSKGGDAADGDTTCRVGRGPVEANAGDSIGPAEEVAVKFVSAGVAKIQESPTLTSGDWVIGQALDVGADGGKVAIDFAPIQIQ